MAIVSKKPEIILPEKKLKLCPVCAGQGTIPVSRGDDIDFITCFKCSGTGTIKE